MVFYKNDFLRPYTIGDNIKFSPADRQPCPVCGHPTGDCTGTSAKPEPVSGFGSDQPNPDAQQFVVEHDIIEERQLSSGTKMKILIAPAGKVISVTEAHKLGLI